MLKSISIYFFFLLLFCFFYQPKSIYAQTATPTPDAFCVQFPLDPLCVTPTPSPIPTGTPTPTYIQPNSAIYIEATSSSHLSEGVFGISQMIYVFGLIVIAYCGFNIGWKPYTL